MSHIEFKLNTKIIDDDEFQADKTADIGFTPFERPIEALIETGFINLDKPYGPTSHDVVATVKKILGISKAGHAGTLDPHVSGVLPIGLLRSTKVLHTLHLLPKSYIAVLKSTSKPLGSWESVRENFLGEIYQFPPLESNVKRRLRKREIYSLEILETKENELLFEVSCEAGTYIRTLCEDMGRANGCLSHMSELRRIKTGVFTEDTCVTLHQLFDAYMDYKESNDESELRKLILPVEVAVPHLPEIIVKNSAVKNVCHGIPLGSNGVLGYSVNLVPGSLVAAKTAKGELIGLGEMLAQSYEIIEGSTQVFKIRSVVMNQELYWERES